MNTVSPAIEARFCVRLEIERLEERIDVLFELVFAVGGTIDDRARDVLEGFFCSDGGGWLVREMEDSEGFFCNDEVG